MKVTVTGAQAKAIDQDAIGRVGIPSLVLMERAALAVADAVCRRVPVAEERGSGVAVWIACGTGNNGADGIAVGRILDSRGYKVTLILAGNLDHATEEHRLQRQIASQLGIPMVLAEDWPRDGGACDVLIDALFGIGLGREITGGYRELMERLAGQMGAKVFAVDIPSGICADTGAVMGVALRADVTVTFGFCKNGLVLYPGRGYAGEVEVADIGFPIQSLERAGWDGRLLERADLTMLPKRRADGNKGTFGKVLIIAGCAGMSGAAYLSALAAYRCGAGLVKVLTVPENRQVLQSQLPEAIVTVYEPAWLGEDDKMSMENETMTAGEREPENAGRFPRFIREQCDWADVIVMGPGLGQAPYVERLVETVLENAYVPMVLDADGLNTVAAHPHLRQYFTENIIITPHIGEMARLTGMLSAEIKEDPIQTARSYSASMGVVCVLKDAATVTADKDGAVYVNTSGCSAMAKAGSGDVLTGVIAGLLAQGMEGCEAAAFGVYLHGLAGEAAAKRQGGRSVLAHELADCLAEGMEGR